jgi:hypothetical protein
VGLSEDDHEKPLREEKTLLEVFNLFRVNPLSSFSRFSCDPERISGKAKIAVSQKNNRGIEK